MSFHIINHHHHHRLIAVLQKLTLNSLTRTLSLSSTHNALNMWCGVRKSSHFLCLFYLRHYLREANINDNNSGGGDSYLLNGTFIHLSSSADLRLCHTPRVLLLFLLTLFRQTNSTDNIIKKRNYTTSSSCSYFLSHAVVLSTSLLLSCL